MIEDYEIEIQSTAREIDRLLHNEFYTAGPEWVKAWYNLSLAWSNTDPAYVVYPRASVPRLLEKATTSHEVFKLALFVAGSRLKQGVELHEDLRDFVARVLLEEVELPRAPSGRPAKNTWGRDYIVFRVMSDLELSHSLPMSQNSHRNAGKEHETTCSEIVEAAIARSRMGNLGRRQIEKIWQRASVREEFRQTSDLRLFHAVDEMNDIQRE